MKTAIVFALSFFSTLSIVALARADYFDDFRDGWYERSPNDPRYDANDPNWTDPNNNVYRDIDNPDWTVYNMLASDYLSQIVSDSVADKALRMACDRIFVYPIGAMAAGVVTGDQDPNTSPTWWDDTTSHYVLVWVYYTGYYNPYDVNPKKRFSFNDPNYDPNYDDPNDDRGRAMILMHSNDQTWSGFVLQLDFDSAVGTLDQFPHSYHLNIQSFAFPDAAMFRRIWIEPNNPAWANYPNMPYGYPNGCPIMLPANQSYNPYNGPNFQGANIDIWERSGFWMLFQFERDPASSPGDPNGKWLRGAIWHGDKYDWDGKFTIEGQCSSPGLSGWGPSWYRPAGGFFLLASSDADYTNGFPADIAYDDVEARTGMFSKDPCKLDLLIVKPDYGSVAIDPDIRDPADPNTPAQKRFRYTRGTNVALTAVPIGGKSFGGWAVWEDPNKYPDANFITIQDSNAVLFLTVDKAYLVEATFKCGSGLPPFLGICLLAMGIGAVLRQRLGGRN